MRPRIDLKIFFHVSPNLQTLYNTYCISTPKCTTDDNSRVVLETIDNEECSDYINASYIDVCYKHTSFIVCSHVGAFMSCV